MHGATRSLPDPLFDFGLCVAELSDDTLNDLHWYGIRAAHYRTQVPPLPPSSAREALRFLRNVLDVEVTRLERAGIAAFPTLAIPPGLRPRRSHRELWTSLAELLSDPRCAGLGELRASNTAEWEAVYCQLDALVAATGPCKRIVFKLCPAFDTRDRIAQMRRLSDALQARSLSAENTLIVGVDWLSVDAAHDFGFMGGVVLAPGTTDFAKCLRVVEHADTSRVIVGTALRTGHANLVGLPRLVEALQKSSLSDDQRRAIVYGNAARFFDASGVRRLSTEE